MRGQLLARDATIHAEPASLIAGASSRGWIAAHERPRQTREITTELLGLAAGRCAGPTVWSFGITSKQAQTMMRTSLIHPRR